MLLSFSDGRENRDKKNCDITNEDRKPFLALATIHSDWTIKRKNLKFVYGLTAEL